jgi:hypothetical protein
MIRLQITLDIPEEATQFAIERARMHIWDIEHEAKRALNIKNQEVGEIPSDEPVVRSSVYGVPDGFNWCNLWHKYGVLIDDEFRGMDNPPVRMRGSKKCINYRYNHTSAFSGHQGQWEVKVIERYLRRIKFTSFSGRKISEKIRNLVNRFPKHYSTQAAMIRDLWVSHRWSGDSRACYINGELRYIDDHLTWRLLKHQAKLLEKVDRLQ